MVLCTTVLQYYYECYMPVFPYGVHIPRRPKSCFKAAKYKQKNEILTVLSNIDEPINTNNKVSTTNQQRESTPNDQIRHRSGDMTVAYDVTHVFKFATTRMGWVANIAPPTLQYDTATNQQRKRPTDTTTTIHKRPTRCTTLWRRQALESYGNLFINQVL